MLFKKLLRNENKWFSAEGPHSDIIISTRARLARNIKGYPFPWKSALSAKKDILEKVKDTIHKIRYINDAWFIKMDTLSTIDKQFLLERHLISQEHTRSVRGKGLVLSGSEEFSIMINEEDHLRLQVIVAGFDLGKAWSFINKLDNELSRHLSFSFMPQIGYLTACPTNVGTALRASCMLHLPALVLTKNIDKVLELLSKLSFTARGLFGEGTQALGNFFQISNRATLGFSEVEIIDNLSGVVRQVKEQELNSRDDLFKEHRHTFEDRVWRSLGILRNCRLISAKEAFSHLSMLCVGLDLGVIKEISRNTINNLFIIVQPAHLQKIEGKVLKEEGRDYIRASIIREHLK